MQSFRLSTAHVKFHQICTLIGSFFEKLLLLKIYKISAKKVQRSYVSWYWRVMQNLKKNWFVVSKMTRIWWILTRALKSLKNLYVDWFLLCKVFNLWPKRYRGVIFLDTEEWCKIWRKMTCGLKNDMRNLIHFHQSTRKSQNLGFDRVLFSKVKNEWA